MLHFFHYPSCIDSIKPSLQFACNFVAINASQGSPFYQICIHHSLQYENIHSLRCFCYIDTVDHWRLVYLAFEVKQVKGREQLIKIFARLSSFNKINLTLISWIENTIVTLFFFLSGYILLEYWKPKRLL
jgi:hypothetical protein